jgi:hypothetical protein
MAGGDRGRHQRFGGRFGLLWVVLCLLSACATYDERVAPAQRAFYSGRSEEAIERLRALVDEQDASQRVTQLELAYALQAAGRYAESAELLQVADDELEILDYTSQSLTDIAAFAFASDEAVFRASPPERLMVNTLNMLNYVGLGDLKGAAVEARRLGILLNQEGVAEEELFANAFASGLAGLVLELAGSRGEAADFWMDVPDSPLRVGEAAAGATLAEGPGRGVVLLVVQRGKAPVRVDAVYRFPMGDTLHPLHVPALVRRDAVFDSVSVRLDGVSQGSLPPLFDYGAHCDKRYSQEFPRLLAAAATQVIPRAVIASALREGIKETYGREDKKGNNQSGTVEALAWLASTALEFGLAAAARTDTRCWSLLPDSFHALRMNVPAGSHVVVVDLHGSRARTLRHEVDVPPGGVVLVNIVSGVYEGMGVPPSGSSRRVLTDSEEQQTLKLLQNLAWFRKVITH